MFGLTITVKFGAESFECLPYDNVYLTLEGHDTVLYQLDPGLMSKIHIATNEI